MIDADRLRSLFLAFFAERGHAILPSASLIPEGPHGWRRPGELPSFPQS
jgi:alanyl-tRNA synthetase